MKYETFKQILEENLGLTQREVYPLMAMAENIALVNKKDPYGFENEQVISYNYFCMQFEKMLLMQKKAKKNEFGEA